MGAWQNLFFQYDTGIAFFVMTRSKFVLKIKTMRDLGGYRTQNYCVPRVQGILLSLHFSFKLRYFKTYVSQK